MTPDPLLEMLYTEHRHERATILPFLIERLDWSPVQLAAERTQRLRAFIAHAKANAPWHRARLRHIDPNTMTEADLERIPPMTKADLVEHFDGIVVDKRLTLDRVLAHLNGPLDNIFIDNSYIAATSGGTTGAPTVTVYDRRAFTILNCLVLRWRIRNARRSGRLSPRGPIAALYHAHSTQLSRMTSKVFPIKDLFRVSFAQPLAQMVEQLNACQPATLIGATSLMAMLVGESEAGRLAIAPQEIMITGQTLSEATRQTIIEQWSSHILNVWGMTEGLFAVPCHAQPDQFHLQDDLGIVEPVSESEAPVGDGVVSSHALFTSFYNYAQPLIRLAVTDCIAVDRTTCACGSHHGRVTKLEGRVEDRLIFGDIKVSPYALFHRLWRIRHVTCFQLVQTPQGINLVLTQNGPVDHEAIVTSLRETLAGCGLENPIVTIERVDEIPRSKAGKHRTVVALPSTAQ